MSEEVEALESKVDALTEQLTTLTEKLTGALEPKPIEKEDSVQLAPLKERLWDDPDKALEQVFEEKSAPILEGINKRINVLAKQEGTKVKESLDGYKKYPEEFDELLDQVDEEFRGNAELLAQLNNTIRGRHLDEYTKEATEAMKGSQTTPTYVEIPLDAGNPEGPKEKVEISDEERSEARKQHLSDEEYLKWSNPDMEIQVGLQPSK